MKQHQIVNKMMETDAFSQWLGIEIIESKEGHCKLKMTVRAEMLIVHWLLQPMLMVD